MTFITGREVKVKHLPCNGFHLIDIHIKSSFFSVYVFDKRTDMADFVNESYAGSRKLSAKIDAVFIPVYHWTKNKLGRLAMTRQIGKIFFNKESLDPSVIQHECTHAALGYFSRIVNGHKKWSYEVSVTVDRGDKEEMFCKIAEILTGVVLETYYDIKGRADVNIKAGKTKEIHHKSTKIERT